MAIDIICTIGPASHDPAVLRELITHGMTVARINMSHGDHPTHQATIQHVRELSKSMGKPVKILADLQGPKIRLGEIKGQNAPTNAVTLTAGQTFIIRTTSMIGNQNEASVDYPGITNDVKLGARILINDGEVRLTATHVHADHIETEVTVGGTISSHKGVNLPDTRVGLPAMTQKDQSDLRFLLLEKVDMVACSFIREAAHLDEIRSYAGITRGHTPRLIAKIETMEGIRNFTGIRDTADGIMVARGDLGVELPYQWVPVLQKAMINECRRTDTYVITATQMLQSMIDHPVPTRAEVTDIFQAVLDGTDAVMLSAESAAGQYPVQSVETLKTVAQFALRQKQEQPFTVEDMVELLSENTDTTSTESREPVLV
ncbi:pyruvate kinase [Brevibacillus dissolubilis]|uniref:pyruvate kinase n=1 Tax=Brevibacillus dissolubilis TaxID=1844116 RepID=UPI001116607C|nr:pyruvate kinase [Brevibacillus dissolubilis]